MFSAIKNNKILFMVIAIVLAAGAFLAVLLINRLDSAAPTLNIKTAAAQSEEAGLLPAQSSIPEKPVEKYNFSAELALSTQVFLRETRRDHIIPTIDTVVLPEVKSWKELKNKDAIKKAAYEKTKMLSKALFGCEMDGDYSFSYYTDTERHRTDFVQIKTKDDVVICTLSADTLELINIDFDFLPKAKPADMDKTPQNIPADANAAAEKIASLFDTKPSSVDFAGAGGDSGYTWLIYSMSAKNGMFFSFGLLNGTLYAVSVYPSQACMNESVYFDADVQRDESIVKLVSPQNFKKGEPGKSDMTKEEAQNMYLSFLTLANGPGNYYKPADMTFYIDNSGTRENYWHLCGGMFCMDIASKNKWILSLTEADLSNPEYDLKEISAENMGGKEYEDFIKTILIGLYKDKLVKVENNARSESECTMLAYMSDKTCYEFFFNSGRLTQVQYYFDDAYLGRVFGWKADNLYINTATGVKFIPQ